MDTRRRQYYSRTQERLKVKFIAVQSIAGVDPCRAVDGDGEVSGYGHDLLAPRDRGGAGTGGGTLIVGRARWPC